VFDPGTTRRPDNAVARARASRDREHVPALQIRRLDPADRADMDAFQEVYAAAELAEDPDAALYSRADGISILTSGGNRFGEGYGAFVGGRMVGELLLTGELPDTLRVLRVWLWVTPSHQRRDVGTALTAYADERARALGRTVLHSQARIGVDRDNGNRRFAERVGFALANTEIERRLPLPADLALLERLAADAAPYHRGYRIVAAAGPVPDDLAPSYADLKNLMELEMPSGDLEVEEGRGTAADITQQDVELTLAGRTRVAAYALDPAGVVVAYAVAAVSNADHDHVDQWGTIVHPGHRGHRLGMAVKCAQLRALTDSVRDKRFIATTNAETNIHMVAINQALGFEVVQVYGDFQKRLTGAEPPRHAPA
jgi:GNAT superfamily N-acetyltransferase